MLIKFKVKGTSVPYNIKYNGIPSSWDTLGNDLVISNVNQQTVQDWTFDISVSDAENKNLYQTIKLAIYRYQIMLYPITLALTQQSAASRGI